MTPCFKCSIMAVTISAIAVMSACTAKDSGSNASPTVGITTPFGVEMLLIPGGTFRMGSDSGQADEAPVHDVELSPFAMDRHEVTQDQLAKLYIPDPSQFKGDRHPVHQMRWSDAAEFCNERSKKEGLKPCYDAVTLECDFEASGYRLPTEAEWEYACRAGASNDRDCGFDGGASKLTSHAYFAENAGKKAHPVGMRKPNRWGIHGMYGNVSEWCHDVYAKDYYAKSAPKNPRGPAAGKHRVLRGGNFTTSRDACQPTHRSHDTPGIVDACFNRNTYGFRCVRKLSEAELALNLFDK